MQSKVKARFLVNWSMTDLFEPHFQYKERFIGEKKIGINADLGAIMGGAARLNFIKFIICGDSSRNTASGLLKLAAAGLKRAQFTRGKAFSSFFSLSRAFL